MWFGVSRRFSDKEFLQSQVKKFFDQQLEDLPKGEVELAEIEGLLEELDIKEKEWLESYQAKSISLVKLDEELKDIERKRVELKSDKIRTERSPIEIPKRPSEQEIENYCREIAELLPELSFEEREVFLHDVLKEIFIANRKAFVRGIIPPEKPLKKGISDACQN